MGYRRLYPWAKYGDGMALLSTFAPSAVVVFTMLEQMGASGPFSTELSGLHLYNLVRRPVWRVGAAYSRIVSRQ